MNEKVKQEAYDMWKSGGHPQLIKLNIRVQYGSSQSSKVDKWLRRWKRKDMMFPSCLSTTTRPPVTDAPWTSPCGEDSVDSSVDCPLISSSRFSDEAHDSSEA